jgi:hypothetical protein
MPDQISEIRRRYAEGESGVQLSVAFNVDRQTIYNHIPDIVDHARQSPRKFNYEEVRSMRARGMSCYAIAKHLRAHHSSIGSIVKLLEAAA